jgi:hypothetical protein
MYTIYILIIHILLQLHGVVCVHALSGAIHYITAYTYTTATWYSMCMCSVSIVGHMYARTLTMYYTSELCIELIAE